MKTGELTTPTSSLLLQTTTSMKDESNRKESEEKMKKTLSEKEIAKSKTEERRFANISYTIKSLKNHIQQRKAR
jgi:hypothetical protein